MEIFTPKVILVTLLLGILGNALWKWFEPSFAFIGRLILNIFSKVFKRFTDSMYEEISKGFREKISHSIFFWLNTMACSFFGFIIFVRIIFPDQSEKFRLSIMSTPVSKEHFQWFSTIYFSVIIVSILIYQIRTRFISDSIGYFNHLIKICRPYMTEDDTHKIVSSFAQIKNKQDYKKAIDPLKDICKKNGIIILKTWFNL